MPRLTDKRLWLKENKLVKAIPLVILETIKIEVCWTPKSMFFPPYATCHISFLFKSLI